MNRDGFFRLLADLDDRFVEEAIRCAPAISRSIFFRMMPFTIHIDVFLSQKERDILN